MAGILVLWATMGLAGEPALAEDGVAETSQAEPTTEPTTEQQLGPCDELSPEDQPWLDRAQNQVYRTACNSAAWFDGFFGDKRYDAATRETYGRLGVSALWDERDGWDQKIRLRARYALPSLRNRGELFLGRGDEQELIDERDGSQFDSLPSTFNTSDEDSLLVGLGYGKGGMERGFRFSVGARINFPVNPYVKASYRRSFALGDKNLLRLRPVTYWKRDEGLGASMNIDLDHLIGDNLMLRFGNWGNVSESPDVEGLAWSSALTLFQGLSNRRAVTYKTFVLGETEADVPIQNYGFEVRYRQRVLRKWLFMEVGSSVSWPRESLDEIRKTNWGVSIGFEMYFGPIPDDAIR